MSHKIKQCCNFTILQSKLALVAHLVEMPRGEGNFPPLQRCEGKLQRQDGDRLRLPHHQGERPYLVAAGTNFFSSIRKEDISAIRMKNRRGHVVLCKLVATVIPRVARSAWTGQLESWPENHHVLIRWKRLGRSPNRTRRRDHFENVPKRQWNRSSCATCQNRPLFTGN